MDKTSFRGVRLKAHGKYQAYHQMDRTWIHLGYFDSFEDAVDARIAYELKEFGYVFERREPRIGGDIALIPLHAAFGVFTAYATIDASDLDVVSGISWSLDAAGYAVGFSERLGYAVLMHRLMLAEGVRGGPDVDHKNNVRLDNRRSNLRLCSRKENNMNRSPNKGRAGRKGVSLLASGNYQARITVDGRTRSLGSFLTADDAAHAYDIAASHLHGEFAHTNNRATQRRAA